MTELEYEQALKYYLDALASLPDPNELADGFEFSDGGDE